MLYVIIILLTAFFSAAFIGAGFFLSSTVIRPEKYTIQSAWDCDVSLGKIDPVSYAALPKEEVYIPSYDGKKIYGVFIPCGSSQKTVIILHGVTFTFAGSIKYMHMFLNRGFNVLMIDHRAHGRSEGTFVTFGYREKHDVSAAIDFLENRFGPHCYTGILAESMGGAIALQHAAVDSRARFIIEDSSFSNLHQLLSYQIKKTYNLPAFPFINIAALFIRLRSGMQIKDISPVNAVKKITVPVLFIHGGADDLVPTSMAQELYDAKAGEKEIYIADGSIHADSFWAHREEYDRRVGAFLKRIGAV